MTSLRSCFAAYFSFTGRLNRFHFNVMSLVPVALYYIGIWIGLTHGLVGLFILLGVPFLMLPLLVRRLHDFDRKGVWALVALIPLVTLPFWVYCAFMPGSLTDNRFGKKE